VRVSACVEVRAQGKRQDMCARVSSVCLCVCVFVCVCLRV